jgi:hypothetical protein
VLVALVAAGCGITPDPRASGRATATPARTAVAPTDAATPTDGVVPSDGAIPTDDPATSEAPSDAPTPTASEAAPSETPAETVGTGAAAACAGNAENRDFYVATAQAVDWAVYCPVLGSGWFVEKGQYRLAGGGWMEIAYKGPGGAHLALREGAACTAADCRPSGDDLGEAAYGDMTGTLLQLSDGYAVVVEPGATPSWSIEGTGLEQAAFETIAAALVRVGG